MLNDIIRFNNFELSAHNSIDSKKYTLFEVLFDPRFESLTIEDRIKIFGSYNSDLEANFLASTSRYAYNGSVPEKMMFDQSVNSVVKMINFGSNDYLSMSQHPEVVNAAVETLMSYGAGPGASLPASGKTKLVIDLEKEIANTFEYEDAVIFPSGYTANTGVLTALLKKNDVAIIDMFAHASIMDGAEGKNKMLFRHNDMRSLESVLMRANRQYLNKIVVVDAVYSMDGDIANLPEISALCKKYGALLMVDEAHAFGVIGKNGLGICDHFNMPPSSIDILVGTMSKSIGCTGGFVTGKKGLIDYLKFASRPYFFTTAPFLATVAASTKSIQIIREDTERKKNLWRNINYFKAKMVEGGFNIGKAETAIFPIIIGNHNKVLDVAIRMGVNGVLCNGVPYPAVSRKQTRMRMTVTSALTPEHLDTGYEVLCKSLNEYDEYEMEMKKAEQGIKELLTA